MERADPGTDISALPDDEATTVAIELGGRLGGPPGRPSGGSATTSGLARPGGARGRRADTARAGAHATLDAGRATLVHGDFHHHNILRHGRGYVAIDAKAMLGEPEFDVPSFLWNPLESAMTAERTERRIAAFAAAGLDEARIRAWTVVRGAYLGFGDEPEEADVIRALVP